MVKWMCSKAEEECYEENRQPHCIIICPSKINYGENLDGIRIFAEYAAAHSFVAFIVPWYEWSERQQVLINFTWIWWRPTTNSSSLIERVLMRSHLHKSIKNIRFFFLLPINICFIHNLHETSIRLKINDLNIVINNNKRHSQFRAHFILWIAV